MQLNKFHLLFAIMFFTTACVQKTFKKTVVFQLDAAQVKNIKTVGIRGGNKPLKWSRNTDMKIMQPDSMYTTTLTFITGYKFVEMKFMVNDEFELKNKDNRRVYFSDKDTTIYKAVFDKK